MEERRKEETKTALDTFKIIKAHTDYKFQLRKFHNDLKVNCANNKEWKLLSKDGKYCIIVCTPCINYKIYYKQLNKEDIENKEILNIDIQSFEVNARSAKDKPKIKPEKEASPVEAFPENYKVCLKPRKDGANSLKYQETINNSGWDMYWEAIEQEILIKEGELK